MEKQIIHLKTGEGIEKEIEAHGEQVMAYIMYANALFKMRDNNPYFFSNNTHHWRYREVYYTILSEGN